MENEDFLGGEVSKIPADNDSRLEIKRCFFLVRKAMTKLDSTLINRDIIFSAKVHIVKAMVFPVVIYRCENWTIKKAEQKELMHLNCGVGEDSLESLGQQGDQTSQS